MVTVKHDFLEWPGEGNTRVGGIGRSVVQHVLMPVAAWGEMNCDEWGSSSTVK